MENNFKVKLLRFFVWTTYYLVSFVCIFFDREVYKEETNTL